MLSIWQFCAQYIYNNLIQEYINGLDFNIEINSDVKQNSLCASFGAIHFCPHFCLFLTLMNVFCCILEGLSGVGIKKKLKHSVTD